MEENMIQIVEDGYNKIHEPSAAIKKQRLFFTIGRLGIFVLIVFIISSIIHFGLSIISNSDFFKRSLIQPLSNIRQYKNWEEYDESTMNCREITNSELITNEFKLFSKENTVFYSNITELISKQKELLKLNDELTNFVSSNLLFKKENGFVPCTCSFKTENDEIISMINPHITKKSIGIAELEEVLPLLNSVTKNKKIPSHITIESIFVDKKIEKRDFSGIDVNTVLHCLNFQKKNYNKKI